MELILINASERSSKVLKQDQKCVNFSLIDKLHPLLEGRHGCLIKLGFRSQLFSNDTAALLQRLRDACLRQEEPVLLALPLEERRTGRSALDPEISLLPTL